VHSSVLFFIFNNAKLKLSVFFQTGKYKVKKVTLCLANKLVINEIVLHCAFSFDLEGQILSYI